MPASAAGTTATRPWGAAAVFLTALVLLSLYPISCRSPRPEAGLDAEDEASQLRSRLADLTRQEQALSAEYSLARNPAPYLVVNLSGRNVELRVRGRILRSFPIRDIRKSARLDSSSLAWVVTDKRPFQQIERHSLTPGAGEEATTAAAKQAPWGPQRMPAEYDLVCADAGLLGIRTLLSERVGSPMVGGLVYLGHRIIERYRHWRASSGEEPRYVIQLRLGESDARLLFWSLPKQLSILVVEGVREIPGTPVYSHN